MTDTTAVVRTATAADSDRIAIVLTAAFLDTPDGPWLVPDRTEWARVYRNLCTALVGFLMEHGITHITTDGHGVAVWQPVPADIVPDPVEYLRLRALARGQYPDRFALLDDVFASHHPVAPHHYLGWMAAHPDHQRRGLGSALLAHHHAYLDEAGIPAYPVATSPGSHHRYLRHGHIQSTAPVFLPDDGPRLWPMCRPRVPARAGGRVVTAADGASPCEGTTW